MIYLDNTTDIQEIFIPRKAMEPEYIPMNKQLEINIDNVNVQDNLMTYKNTVKCEGYSTVTVNMNIPMATKTLNDNGIFKFDEPVGTVEVDTSAYGDERYVQGYQAGYNDRDKEPLALYTVTDLITAGNAIPVGSKTRRGMLVKGTITRSIQIDLNYGNARYWISDDMGNEIMVFRGLYYWGEKFQSENEIQVGQEVNLVCAVQNYNGTPQIASGSYLIQI